MASKSSVQYLETLQRQIGEVVSTVRRLPFSEEAKAEIVRLIESHAKTAYESIKRAYNDED